MTLIGQRQGSTQAYSTRGRVYPFASVVGRLATKRALMLSAVEPRLNGVLIGTDDLGETQEILRSFISLLAEIDRYSRSEPFSPPVIEVPQNVTEDRLLGGLDLEVTLASGRRAVSKGLLAAADNGYLIVNNIDLIDAAIAGQIANAIDTKKVVLEREGLSATQPARFTVFGSFDQLGDQRQSLLSERIDLIVAGDDSFSTVERTETIARRLNFEDRPDSFEGNCEIETAELQNQIYEARRLLPLTRISTAQTRRLTEVALRLGVRGNRWDLVAVRVARANAAFSARREVDEEDLIAAIQLVFVPRATEMPPSESSRADGERSANDPIESDEHFDAENESAGESIEDLIVKAVDALTPQYSELVPAVKTKHSAAGRRSGDFKHTRGRYVRSVMKHRAGSRIAIDATLRAAAPLQRLRGKQTPKDPKRVGRARRVTVEPSDLRFKQLRHRSGLLFIFAVDASGSMTANRMSQAKGALIRLLARAYVHRDKVALLTFKRDRADVLLGPTRSVDVAKRLVDWLPAGGRTPISAGLVKASQLARAAKLHGMPQAVLVLFTDGRANVPLADEETGFTLDDELMALGEVLSSDNVSTIVVDTRSQFVSTGNARRLADLLGAKYLYLPRWDAAAVEKSVYRLAEELRGSDK